MRSSYVLTAALAAFSIVNLTSAILPTCAAQPPAKAETKPERKLPGIQGVMWGDTKAQAQKALTAKGIALDAKYSDKNTITTESFKMGGSDVDYAYFFFGSEGCYKAVFYMKVWEQEKPKHEFDSLREVINSKYGKPKKDFYFFDEPYSQGDGYETQAIRLGKSTIVTFWEIPNDDNQVPDMIGLELAPIGNSKTIYAKLSYQDSVRTKKAIAELKKAKSADF